MIFFVGHTHRKLKLKLKKKLSTIQDQWSAT